MRQFEEDGVIFVKLEGNIQQAQTDDLENLLESFHARRHYKVVLDLTEVSHICSSALGIMVTYKRLYKQEGGDLKLIVVSPNLQKLFEVTMLDQIFDIAETKTEAIEKFD
ncbi:MAG: STAS domain-containing protein [Leptospiraceae bacterium]|nr:STAS domain-containing protein [Leptospiraceae bacterium]MDW8307480.1 STAS domain-containing protein [Leptospiraceae bacterium]